MRIKHVKVILFSFLLSVLLSSTAFASSEEEYAPVLERYARAVREGWDMQTCQDNEVCYLLAYVNDLSEVGYCLMDVNNDGTSELLIGNMHNSFSENYDDMIYSGYSIVDGDINHFLESAEREAYYLCDKKNFVSEGSASALDYYLTFYELPKNSNHMRKIKEAGMDEYDNEANPWFIDYGDGRREYVSESEFVEEVNSHDYGNINWKPLSQY